MKFPTDKSLWSDKQLDKYLNMIEKLVDMLEEYTEEQFNQLSIEDKLSVGRYRKYRQDRWVTNPSWSSRRGSSKDGRTE